MRVFGKWVNNIKLFDLDSHVVEYIDARRVDILEILKAGINVFPYVHEVSLIDGKRYVDAAIVDIIGADLLKKRHPNEKIIIVLNRPMIKKWKYRIKNIIEGKFMEWMFNDPQLYKLYSSAEDRLAKDLEIIKHDDQFILITPSRDIGIGSITTDKKLLEELYNIGISEGERVIKNLELIS